MSKIIYLKRNKAGIDYWIGDIHGCFTLVEEALKKVGFDKSKDRLICVGDLVDRGQENQCAVWFLEQSWVICLQGNHDAFVYHTARLLLVDDDAAVANSKDANTCSRNGGIWVFQEPKPVLEGIVRSFSQLPIAIEYQDDDGQILAGVVHAEVAQGSSWAEVKALLSGLPYDYVFSLDDDEDRLLSSMVWGRTRHDGFKRLGSDYEADYKTKGVPLLICGHNVVRAPEEGPFKIDNNRLIDHGICKTGEVRLYTFEDFLR